MLKDGKQRQCRKQRAEQNIGKETGKKEEEYLNTVLREREAEEGNLMGVLNHHCREATLKPMPLGTHELEARAIRKSQQNKKKQSLSMS